MKKGKITTQTALRLKAEARLSARQKTNPAGPSSRADERRLAHELEVHQIELEIQNEELRAARLETEAGLERYVSLFDFAPLGYTTLDLDGTIRAINHAAAQLVEKSRSQLIGRSFEGFVSVRDRPAFRMLLGRALDSGLRETCELELSRSHGDQMQGRLIAIMMPGAERRILLAFEDVTDRKIQERRVAETEAALREADRRKDEFLAVLSHELRNPLGAVRNSLIVLSRAEPDGAQAAKARAIIDRQVSQLIHIVDDLLDVTRIVRGKIELQRARLDLGELVLRTVDDHRPSFEASGLQLDSHVEPRTFWVQADAARLVQALGNLLANAEKFTPPRGSVVVSLDGNDDRKVALRVRDSGAGIEPDVLPRVLESFVQGPQTIDRSRGGLGLGLAMVKGIVDLHGGSVTVASEGAGRGTEVTILLPLVPAPAQPAAPISGTIATPARRVLVIDDNPDNADSMQQALELDGHDVRVAYDGPAGIDLARTFRPDVAVCDIGLPGMDGYAVARAFRADEALRGVVLIAVSGYTQPDDLDRAAHSGFDKHLAKPASIEELERFISTTPEAFRPEANRPLPDRLD